MSIGNHITTMLNRVEHFNENASKVWLPVKVLGWIILILALLITNIIAILQWPFSALTSKIKPKKTASGEPIAVSDESELKQLIETQPTLLVDFWAQWCGPCLLMNNTINDVAKDYKDQVTIAKVDVSINSELSNAFNVRGLPTVILFQNTQEIARKSGALTKTQLSRLIISGS